jgi:hypothetical protein
MAREMAEILTDMDGRRGEIPVDLAEYLASVPAASKRAGLESERAVRYPMSGKARETQIK